MKRLLAACSARARSLTPWETIAALAVASLTLLSSMPPPASATASLIITLAPFAPRPERHRPPSHPACAITLLAAQTALLAWIASLAIRPRP
jgi:hypothetical protein